MLTKFPNGIFASPLLGGFLVDIFAGGTTTVYYVDADKGNNGNSGLAPDEAKATIQSAVTTAAARNVLKKGGSVIYVKPKYMAAGSTDPGSYAENIVIPAAGGDRMVLVGASINRTQGGLPQLKVGTTTTQALLTVRAPGCTILNLGFNGVGGTGGGILLDDDASTKSAFGTAIMNCHFKNCVGTTATDSRTGGAIQWAATGGAWQSIIKGNIFYKNVGDVVLKGTTSSVPQDVVIEDNTFMSASTSATDCNLYLAGGSGMSSVIIRNNVFGALPALGSGSVVRYMDLTGCSGVLANNYFGCATQGSGLLTFKAAGSGAKVPATVFMAGNYGEADTEGDTGYIYRAA